MADEKELYGQSPDEYAALTKANAQNALTALGKQRDAAQAGVGTAQKAYDELGTAEKGALGTQAANTARLFQASQARGGGGTLAGARQATATLGVAQGQTRGEYAQKRGQALGEIQGAQEKAAKSETDYATESQKLVNAAQQYGAAAPQGYQAAKDIFQKYADEEGGLVMTNADRQAAGERILAAIAVEPNENKKHGMIQAYKDIMAGKITAGGAYNTV